jgi:hypothetical protein
VPRKPPAIKAKVKLGNNSRGYSSTKGIAEAVAKDILKFVTTNASSLVGRRLERLAKKMEFEANRELYRMASYMATNVIGTPSARYPGSKDIKIDGTTIAKWAALTPRTIALKSRGNFDRKGSGINMSFPSKGSLHFIRTGDLRKAVAAAGPSFVEATGGVRVTIKPRKQAAEEHAGPASYKRIAEINIELGPRLGPALLPSIKNRAFLDVQPDMRLEKRVFKDPHIIEKLTGPQRDGFPFRHRPLIQPVLSYWMFFKIPAQLKKTMEKSFYVSG